jgi:hypothetical protein
MVLRQIWRHRSPKTGCLDLVCLCSVRPVGLSAAAVGLLVFKQPSRLLTRVKRQLIFVRFWLAVLFQVLVSCFSFARSGIRRVPKHCREYTLIC